MAWSLDPLVHHLDLAPDGMLIVDSNSRIRGANKSAFALLRYSGLTGHLLSEVLGLDEAHARLVTWAVANRVSRAMGDGRAFSVRRGDGSRFLASISLRSIEIDGELMALAAMRDVSALVSAKEETERLHGRLDTLMGLARVGTWEVRGDVRHYSRQLLALLGHDSPVDDRDVFFDAIHPFDRDRFLDSSAAARRTGTPFHIEFRIRHADGAWRWFETKAFVVSGDSPAIGGLVMDITSRRLYEDVLRNSEQNLRAIVDAHPSGILISRDGAIVDCNRSAAELTGHSGAAELIGKRVTDVLDSGELSTSLVATPDGTTRTWRLRAVSGQTKMVSERTLEIVRNGAPHLLTVVRDISGELLAAEEKRASERLASLGLMAASIAHDINNPLSVVLLSLETLGRSMSREEAKEPYAALERARDAAQRIANIVSDLKVYPREDRTVPAPVCLRQVIDSALRLARLELRDRARLVVDVPEDLWVEAVEHRLSQVILNLLSNAAHAIVPGSADSNEVIIRASGQGRVVELAFEDTGPGVPPSIRSRLFTPFVTTRAQSGGTGLGLSICQRIVQQLGGEMHYEDRVGGGARFVLKLPSAPATASIDLGGAPGFTRERGRVLIVDDEAAIGKAIVNLLDEDHDVATATSGAEALAMIAAGAAFDVIVTDLSMPDINGEELYRIISRNHPALADRMLFMSGGAPTAEMDRFLREEMKGRHVRKPFDVQKLLHLIDQTIERRYTSVALVSPVVD